MRSAYFNSTDSGHPKHHPASPETSPVPSALFSKQKHENPITMPMWFLHIYLYFYQFTIVHPSRVGRIACSKMDNPDCTDCTWRDSSKARRSWSVKRFGISLSARETPQVCHHVSYVSLEFEVVLMVPTCSNSQLLMTSCDEMWRHNSTQYIIISWCLGIGWYLIEGPWVV